MKPWQQLDELFHAALEHEPEARGAFLDEACAGDDSLRKQVESLLAAHEQAGSFIESPAIEVEAREVAADPENRAAELGNGDTVSHYRIISKVGSGGMGDVYLAQDTVLSRQVALKLLPEYFTRDQDRLRRFQQEARAASALNHPNIITIFEIGQVDDRHFIVTEFIDGATLRQHFFGEGRHTSGTQLRLREVLDIAIQTADALAAAHEAGIVHRDIKPENIMVRRRDRYVKVLDFGLAKLTEGAVDTEGPTRAQVKTSAGVVMGTPSYMSPEQARGEQVDARTDIWSLGVVLYEMVAGSGPFERATPSEVIALILEREPAPLARFAREVPSELERIVSKALTKDRETRYQTAKDLLVDLRRLRQRLEVEAEIERTSQPREKSSEVKAVATGSEQTAATTARAVTVETGDAAVAHSTSSAAYLVQVIKLHRGGSLLVLAALVALTATIVYLAYSRYAAGSRAGMIRSVAVLPFENLTNNADSEYLSDGISESVINSLAQLPGIKVSARNSSFQYKGKNADPQEVANALGVEAILSGRIVQRGDTLVISVELVDARDKTHVWGEQYNRKATDLLAIPPEIASEIGQRLRLRLSAGEQQQLAKRESVNPQAYDLYLKGRALWVKGGDENKKKAIEYYEQAIAVDPGYALVYAELSGSYSALITLQVLPQNEFGPKAEAAALKAVELDDNLAEAHLAVANVKIDAWEWPAAEREIKRALELNPNLAATHDLYAEYHRNHGRREEAVAELERFRELDPLSMSASQARVTVLAILRQNAEALELQKKILELNKSNPAAYEGTGRLYVRVGQYREAIAAYQESIRLGKNNASKQILLAAAYAHLGERDKAREIIEPYESGKEYISPVALATVYVALGERDQAFAALERAYAAHDQTLRWLRSAWDFDVLHDDPRFQDLARRIGLLT